jgi:hypothetical protein
VEVDEGMVGSLGFRVRFRGMVKVEVYGNPALTLTLTLNPKHKP